MSRFSLMERRLQKGTEMEQGAPRGHSVKAQDSRCSSTHSAASRVLSLQLTSTRGNLAWLEVLLLLLLIWCCCHLSDSNI